MVGVSPRRNPRLISDKNDLIGTCRALFHAPGQIHVSYPWNPTNSTCQELLVWGKAGQRLRPCPTTMLPPLMASSPKNQIGR